MNTPSNATRIMPPSPSDSRLGNRSKHISKVDSKTKSKKRKLPAEDEDEDEPREPTPSVLPPVELVPRARTHASTARPAPPQALSAPSQASGYHSDTRPQSNVRPQGRTQRPAGTRPQADAATTLWSDDSNLTYSQGILHLIVHRLAWNNKHDKACLAPVLQTNRFFHDLAEPELYHTIQDLLPAQYTVLHRNIISSYHIPGLVEHYHLTNIEAAPAQVVSAQDSLNQGQVMDSSTQMRVGRGGDDGASHGNDNGGGANTSSGNGSGGGGSGSGSGGSGSGLSTGHGPNQNNNQPHLLNEEFWHLLKRAVCRMYSLQTLNISITSESVPQSAGLFTLLQDLTLPALRTLTWSLPASEKSLTSFFERHPRLRTLCITSWDHEKHPTLPSYLLPNLHTLDISNEAMLIFVAGRQVKNLRWRGFTGKTPPLAIPYLEAIEVLSLHQVTERVALSGLAPHLKQVRHLILLGVHKNLLRYLPKIPQLRRLELVPAFATTRVGAHKKGVTNMARKAFKKCPNLKFIEGVDTRLVGRNATIHPNDNKKPWGDLDPT